MQLTTRQNREDSLRLLAAAFPWLETHWPDPPNFDADSLAHHVWWRVGGMNMPVACAEPGQV